MVYKKKMLNLEIRVKRPGAVHKFASSMRSLSFLQCLSWRLLSVVTYVVWAAGS